jgi:hypothetical protein
MKLRLRGLRELEHLQEVAQVIVGVHSSSLSFTALRWRIGGLHGQISFVVGSSVILPWKSFTSVFN